MRWILRAKSFPVFLFKRLVRRRLIRIRLYLLSSALRFKTKRLSVRCCFRLSPLFLLAFLTPRLWALFALTFFRLAFFLSVGSFGRRNPLKIFLSLRRSLALRRLLFLLCPLSFNSLRISLSARCCFLLGNEYRIFRSRFVIPLKRLFHLPPNRLNCRLSLRMRL